MFGHTIKDSDILPLLKFQTSLDLYTHPSPLLLLPHSQFSPFLFFVMTSMSFMETRCGLLRWKRQRERKKLSTSLCDTSLAEMRGVQSVPSPVQGRSEAGGGGVPRGCGWVTRRVAGLGDPESASLCDGGVFSAGPGKPHHVRGLIKSNLKRFEC